MSRSVVLGVIVGLLGGIVVSAQVTLLAKMGRTVGSVPAGLFTYIAGGILGALTVLAVQFAPGVAHYSISRVVLISSAAAGALGVVLVTAIAFSSARVGVAAGLAVNLVGQMVTAIFLDALATGAAAVPINLRRVAGLLVLGLGTYLLLPK